MQAAVSKLGAKRVGGRKGMPWAWIGLVAVSGLAVSVPAVLSRWRQLSYRRQEDRMDAYIRGCLTQSRDRS